MDLFNLPEGQTVQPVNLDNVTSLVIFHELWTNQLNWRIELLPID